MNDRPVLQPGPDHPITVTENPNEVTVSVAGRIVARSRRALTLREANYPPVSYLPISDADETMLVKTTTTSYCPYKGDASYYSISAGGDASVDAIWVYESPYPAVAEIKDHIAFYPDRVDSITEIA